MERTCNTCQHRNAQGICTNHDSEFFGSRVADETCPVGENYDAELWGYQIMRTFMKVWWKQWDLLNMHNLN